jgi:hypothetical protein
LTRLHTGIAALLTELQSWGNSTTFSTAFYRLKVAANIIIHDPSCAINHEVQIGLF